MKFLKVVVLLSILFLTWAIAVFHRGVLLPPVIPNETSDHFAKWIPKSKIGINQIILKGTPFEIGQAFGKKTKDLIYTQEKILITQLNQFLPNQALRRFLEVLATRWFWGIDMYFSPWMLQEIYGVSLSTSSEFDDLGNPFTRQIAYHGLHEVGQMAVDQGSEAMGCTVVAVPFKNSWIIGRNFDFEGGRIFDSEKIMKWVFPKDEFAYLSVIWAGMVGAVTGVNEKGVYISLNAAGSTDFARYGTPSTLIITDALKKASTAAEAVKIIQSAQMFITDIFVVSDRATAKLFRVEKSPKATEIIELHKASAITNHLTSPRWLDDSINHFRTYEQTSLARSERAEKLLSQYKDKNAQENVAKVLSILRDKGEVNGRPLHLGNRKAIDALIANHSVIYNESENIFYVSHGPGVSGGFTGFDLALSFKEQKPVVVQSLPPDPMVTPDLFLEVRHLHKEIGEAESLIRRKKCDEAKQILDRVEKRGLETYNFYLALGNYHKCTENQKLAKMNWQKALDLSPAYKEQVKFLEEALHE